MATTATHFRTTASAPRGARMRAPQPVPMYFSASFGDFPDSIHVQRNNTGYFTEALLPAGPTVWTLGARLDDNSQFGAHGTYRAGLVYRLTEQMRLRVSAGTGFKEPTFFENYAHGFVKGNPNLRPEQSFSWEVGAE